MTTQLHQHVQFHKRGINRRHFVHTVSASAAAAGTLSLRDFISLQAAELRKQNRAIILLWMQGGPSQLETFDPKPATETGGPTQAIATSVPGIQIAQDWKQTAKVMQDIALIRSMTNKEGNHQRAAYQLHTGYVPAGSVKHPSLAANITKEIGSTELDLPAIVSIGRGAQSAGFLGVEYEPFVVSRPGEMPDKLRNIVTEERYRRRLNLLGKLEQNFQQSGGRRSVSDHKKLYGKAAGMVLSSAVNAFDISSEPAELREQYGDNNFGKGCLLARRLIESGSTFVEVRQGNWDTHQDNFERSRELSQTVDPAMATLITDLKERGMLERTLVVWMGEFGRTPRINARTGRDHYPRVFNAALAGGGIRGGQVVGSSTADGTAIQDRPVTVPDLLCSICHSLKVDPRTENMSPLGRPMKIVDGGTVVTELFS